MADNPVLRAALDYIARGFAVVPIPHREKAPKRRDWPNLRLSAENAAVEFASEKMNIGVLLGTPSSNVIDIDLDCDEAIQLAPSFFPVKGAIFGRRSKPHSHRLFRIRGSVKTAKFADPDGTCLLEIRSDGAQTVVPPSVHPSGESVEWEIQIDPPDVEAADLERWATATAVAALLARNWPAQGQRQEAAMAIAGALARAQFDEGDIQHFIQEVAAAADDEEADGRGSIARYAISRLEASSPLYGFNKLAEIFGEKVARRAYDWLGAERGDKQPRESEIGILIAHLNQVAEFWRAHDGTPCVTIDINGRRENMRVKSRSFRQRVGTISFRLLGKPLGSRRDEIVAYAEAAALEGEQHDTFIRVAHVDGVTYVDLGDDTRRAVQVTQDGWRVVENPPVRFLRSSGMLAFPEPVRGGSLEELRILLNVTDEDFILVAAALLSTYAPAGPYFVLVVGGEQGSAKSTLTELLRALSDPHAAPIRALPMKEDDFIVAAVNGWVLAFDNVSHIPPALADALCRVATGGGFSKRELYTDLDEVVVHLQRPVFMNGIPQIITRSDLLGRAIVVTLSAIPESARRAHSELEAEFMKARPRIFGAVLDAVSAGLRHLSGVKLDAMPRMADAVRWITAIEMGGGVPWAVGEFQKAYRDVEFNAQVDLALNEPITAALERLLERELGHISMTATDLLRALNGLLPENESRPQGWPRQPNYLANVLRRLAPALRLLEIEVRQDGRDSRNRKLIDIRRSGGRF